MEKKNVIPFKERYEAILSAFGITVADLVELLGVDKKKAAPFYKYRTGDIKKPGSKTLKDILRVLPDLSPDFLYEGIEPIKIPASEKSSKKDSVAFEELIQIRITLAELTALVASKDLII